jgi:hypothetical protein
LAIVTLEGHRWGSWWPPDEDDSAVPVSAQRVCRRPVARRCARGQWSAVRASGAGVSVRGRWGVCFARAVGDASSWRWIRLYSAQRSQTTRTHRLLYSSFIRPSQQDSLLYTQFSRIHPSSISSYIHYIHRGTHSSLYRNLIWIFGL